MQINERITMRKEKSSGDIITNAFTQAHPQRYHTNEEFFTPLDRLYNNIVGVADKNLVYNNWLSDTDVKEIINSMGDIEIVVEDTPSTAQLVTRGIDNMIKFFTEFNFQPNFRFLNTLSRYGKKEGRGYIARYFELINSPYCAVITEKMKSPEFKQIENDFFAEQTQKQINNRFKLYYGSQGTGKTTQALQDCNNACMVCHNAMLPADLLENFNFNEGKAEFQPSALYNAMVNGTPITLDEINLLPFESLRFLQGILDGKASFEYKDKTVNIADGFMIIGTMNLTVNGMTFGLPEPLVDRCAETRKFELTADNLLSAVL